MNRPLPSASDWMVCSSRKEAVAAAVAHLVVMNCAIGGRVLQQDARHILVNLEVLLRADQDLQTQAIGPRLAHSDGLRVALVLQTADKSTQLGCHSDINLPPSISCEPDRHTSCRHPVNVHQSKLLKLLGTRQLTETRNLSFLPRARALHMVMASAAAVASSSRDELDSCKRTKA